MPSAFAMSAGLETMTGSGAGTTVKKCGGYDPDAARNFRLGHSTRCPFAHLAISQAISKGARRLPISTSPSGPDTRRIVMLQWWRRFTYWLRSDLADDRLQGLNSRREGIMVIIDGPSQQPHERFGFIVC